QIGDGVYNSIGCCNSLRAGCTKSNEIFDHNQPIRIAMKYILGLTQPNADWYSLHISDVMRFNLKCMPPLIQMWALCVFDLSNVMRFHLKCRAPMGGPMGTKPPIVALLAYGGGG